MVDELWAATHEQEEHLLHLEKHQEKAVSLTQSALSEMRSKMVARIVEILNVEPGLAQALLAGVNWKEDVLMTRYFEDKDRLMKEVGLGDDSPGEGGSPGVKNSNDDTEIKVSMRKSEPEVVEKLVVDTTISGGKDEVDNQDDFEVRQGL